MWENSLVSRVEIDVGEASNSQMHAFIKKFEKSK